MRLTGLRMLLTLFEVRQHLLAESNRSPLEDEVLKELNTVPFLPCLDDGDLQSELEELLPQIFERRLDACVFCDTLPVTAEQIASFFGGRVTAKDAGMVAGLGRQVRGEAAE